MKVLFVAPWVPNEVRPRSLALLRIIAEEHEVMFLGLARHAREAAQADRLPVTGSVLVRNSRPASMGRSLVGLASGRSLQTSYADVPELRASLDRCIRDWAPDLVHFNVFRTAHMATRLEWPPVVVDMDELRSTYYASIARASTSPGWRTIGRVEGPRMAAGERDLIDSQARVLVSCPDDVIGPRTFLVRTPCDFEPVETIATEPIILFVGRLHYQPNIEGIRWFARRCFPHIRAAHPRARLRIVGEAPPRSVRDLAGDGIEVVADVDDVRPYYAQAQVAIVPVGSGTGVQMKLIQALATGVPVVSFAGPIERARITGGVDALACDAPEEWVAAVCRLLTDSDFRSAVAASGRAWVRAHHHSDVVRTALWRAYESALNTAPLSSRAARSWS